MDDSVQCWSNLRSEYTKIWHSNSSYRTRRFEIIHWFNHLLFFDPQHSFRRKLWANTYLSLESYLPTSKRWWCGEFVEMKIWNLQSLLVCSIILWKISLTGDDWISGWRSWLASLNRWLVLTHHMWWCVFWKIRTPLIQLLRIRCWRRRFWICKNVSDFRCVSQMLGGPFLRLGIPRERLSIPPGSGWGGKDTGWLATWECPLRTDSASWKSLESFMQVISYCNSWILPVNSRIVSRSSINFLLENVSNVGPWNRFNSSISLRLFIWASRSSRFCSNNCSWRSCWSRRSCSSPLKSTINFTLLRLDNSFNFWILHLS